MTEQPTRPTLHCPCDGAHEKTVHTYEARPDGEVAFDLGDVAYRRDLDRCGLCQHVFSRHTMNMSALYSGEYVDATYGGKLKTTFDRITTLPAGQSDNVARAANIQRWADANLPDRDAPRTLLDVGSGLAVFPFQMRTVHGWECTALDPDERAAEHAREVAGVSAHCGDFFEVDTDDLGPFDAITFNKVLEHVLDPVAMLRKAVPLIHPDGFIYIELPDGEGAWEVGPSREEYFIDHHHVFSAASLITFADRAGLRVMDLERLVEPSGKYTLRAFAVRQDLPLVTTAVKA